MAAKIHELRAARQKLAQEANAALTAARDKAKAEGRALSAEETKAQDDFDVRLKAQDDEIAIEERLLERERRYGSAAPARDPNAPPIPGSGPQPRVDVEDPNFVKDPRKGFASSREFLAAALAESGHRDRESIEDERLRYLAQAPSREDRKVAGEDLSFLLPIAFTPRHLATVGSDEAGEYADTYGGFSVVAQRLAPRPLLGFEGDPTAGRTEMLPMTAPSVEIEAATDKNHTSSVSAGLTVTRKPETVAADPSRMAREMITLKAAGLYGLSYVSEILLADSPATFVARLDNGFRNQFAAYMLNEKLRGTGGDQYLGVLTALESAGLGPTVTIAKESGQAADTIVADNVIKMRAQCWGYGNAVWLANHDTYPQNAKLAVPIGVGGSTLIYQQSIAEDRPDMLLGRPIFYTEYASTLGDLGDIGLYNFSQLLEGLYQPLQSAESVHVRFVNHERAFKFWLRNCGAPAWRVPLTPAKSASKLSPFVVLAAR